MQNNPPDFIPDHIPDFIPEGQFQSDEDRFGGLSGGIKAGLAGVARGATFGLSDVGLTKSGLVNPETLKGLQEENPTASFAGELAGTVAPALVGDEASLANLPGLVTKGARAVEGAASALPKAASKALGYASEGAAYGLGQSVSEYALGDHDLVSEKTLANIGLASALTGGLGALVGSSAKLLDKSTAVEKLAAEKLPSSAITDTTMPAAEKISFIEALGKQKSNAKEISEAGDLIGAPVLPGQVSASKIVQDATSAISKSPTFPGVVTQQAMQKGFDAVDGVIKESLGASEHLTPYDAGALIKEQVQNTIDKIHEPLKAYYAEREALGQTIDLPDNARLKLYDKLIDQSQNFGSVGSEGSKIIRDLAERALSQNNVSQLDKLITEIGSDQRKAFRAADTNTSKALGSVADTLKEFQVSQIAKQGKALAKDGALGAEEVANQVINQHKEITRQYKEFKEILGDLASDQRLGKKNLTAGSIENVLDGIPNEKVIDKMFDPKNADGLMRLQKNFPDVFKTLIDQKKSQILQASIRDDNVKIGEVLKQLYDEKKLSSKVRDMMFLPDQLKRLDAAKTWMESLPKDINPSGTSKAEAFREFLTNPIKATANNFTGYVTQKLIDKFSSNPEEAAKVMTLINTEKAARKTTKRIQEGVSAIFDSGSGAASAKVSSKVASYEDYKKRTDAIKKIANNVQTLSDTVSNTTEGLYQHAPNVGTAMQGSLIRGAQFLNSKILPSDVGIFEKELEPSKSEIARFNGYYNLVHDPVLALDQVKDGTIVPDTVETLQAVYPKMYQEMKQDMLSKVSDMKDPSTIPYRTRISMSFFMGEPVDKSFSLPFVMANQATFQPPPQQQAGKSPKEGRNDLTLANRTGINHGKMEES